MTVHSVRDGEHRIIRFEGEVIGAGTSKRPGAARWSELTVYRLQSGDYLISKVGHTSVAHRPVCPRVTKKMVSWLEAGEEGRIRRIPCPECQPKTGNSMDPHTMLERTRRTLLMASSPQQLVEILTERIRPGEKVPTIVRTVLAQCAQSSESVSRYCSTVSL